MRTAPSNRPEITAGVRVTHANACRSYGAGEIVEIIASHIRPPSKARVLFDGERCARLVWLGDLTPIASPETMTGSPQAMRLVWPLDRTDEPLAPVVA